MYFILIKAIVCEMNVFFIAVEALAEVVKGEITVVIMVDEELKDHLIIREIEI